jgi:hypothetical protein
VSVSQCSHDMPSAPGCKCEREVSEGFGERRGRRKGAEGASRREVVSSGTYCRFRETGS